MGRPKKPIDGDQVRRLAKLGLTQRDIGDFFGCAHSVISERYRTDFHLERVMNCSPVFPGVFGMKAARNRPAEVPKRRNPCVFRHYSS